MISWDPYVTPPQPDYEYRRRYSLILAAVVWLCSILCVLGVIFGLLGLIFQGIAGIGMSAYATLTLFGKEEER